MIRIAQLADVILILHFIWVLAILLPIPLIFAGARLGWRWIRNYTFRVIHLAMMGVVALESILGIACPLTTWEDALRQKAAQSPYGRSFVAYWVGRILFYEFPPWVFTVVYLVTAAIIVGMFRGIPPRRTRVERPQ